jgi:hypothetical protein
MYKAKYCELKIERYKSNNSVASSGKKIGYKKINLSHFINMGLKHVTFQMD